MGSKEGTLKLSGCSRLGFSFPCLLASKGPSQSYKRHLTPSSQYGLTTVLCLETIRRVSSPLIPGHVLQAPSSLPILWTIFSKAHFLTQSSHPFFLWCLVELKVTHQQNPLYHHPLFWMFFHFLILTKARLSPEDLSVLAAHSSGGPSQSLQISLWFPGKAGPRKTRRKRTALFFSLASRSAFEPNSLEFELSG